MKPDRLTLRVTIRILGKDWELLDLSLNEEIHTNMEFSTHDATEGCTIVTGSQIARSLLKQLQ